MTTKMDYQSLFKIFILMICMAGKIFLVILWIIKILQINSSTAAEVWKMYTELCEVVKELYGE